MATNHTEALQIARRYVAAIFALALESRAEQAVVEEFTVLAQAIEGSAPLAEALTNPTLSTAHKASILAALLVKAQPLTAQAVAVIANAGRAGLLAVIATQLQEKLAAHKGEMTAIVTSARALPSATQQQLVAALSNATGKAVTLQLHEDAAVLGGLSIQLGSLALDATLAGALNHMREQLLASNY